MLFCRQRVDRADAAVVDRAQHRVLVDHQMPVPAHREFRSCPRLRRAGLDRTPIASPFLKAAIQYSSIIMAIGTQHPPDTRRPLWRCRAVENDPAAVAYPETCHRRGKFLRPRQHETELR